MVEVRPKCPTCDVKLVFSGDGRSLLCERCHFKRPLQKENRFSLRDLIEMDRMGQELASGQPHNRTSARIWLADGDAALKDERPGDAYFAYGFVLKTQATDDERALAWLGLAKILPEPEEKRHALEYALLNNPRLATASREIAILEGRLQRTEIIDPDVIEGSISDTPLETEAFTFDCPQCSASISHDPLQAGLFCQFCGYSGQLEEVEAAQAGRQVGEGPYEQEFILALATSKGHLNPLNQRAFDCDRCGTPFILDEGALSIICPFCEASYVTEAAESEEIMAPNAIIPLKIDPNEAIARYKNWLRASLAKRDRSQITRVGRPNGLYLPVWTFDVGGAINWKGHIRENERQRSVSGTEFPFFNDIVIPASPHNGELIKRVITPIEPDTLTTYSPHYLSGWPAERYTLALADAALQARKVVVQHYRKRPNLLTRKNGVQGIAFQTSDLAIASYRLLYIPLWVVHYHLGKDRFEVYISGVTGEIEGERPKQPLRRLVRGWFG